MNESVEKTLQEQLFQDLLEINEAMVSDTENMLGIILAKGASIIKAQHGSIRLLRSVGGRTVLVLEAFFGDGWTEKKMARIMALGESISGAVADTGCSRCCSDVTNEPDYEGSFPEFKSKICVPIRIGDNTIGVMNLNSRAVGAFDDEDVEVAEIFARQTALAVNNVRLNRREERARKSLALSREINRAISATLNLDDVMNTLLGKLAEIYTGVILDIFMYDPAEQTLRKTYRLKEDGLGSATLGLNQGLVGAAARDCQVINVGDVRKDPRYSKARESTRSELTVPLVQCDELIGVMNLESDELDAFTEDDERLLVAVALSACIAIRNANEYETLQQTQRELQLATRRIMDMEDNRRFALTNYIHTEVQKSVGRLCAQARALERQVEELEQQVDKMRFDLNVPSLPRNMRVELIGLVQETLPRMYQEEAVRHEHTLQLAVFDDIKELDPGIGVLIYHLVRGAITNVYRHARASHIDVAAERKGDVLLLRVTDDGKGFDPECIDKYIEDGHFFFHEIRIRAEQLGGTFDVESEGGKGTRLELRVPLDQNQA